MVSSEGACAAYYAYGRLRQMPGSPAVASCGKLETAECLRVIDLESVEAARCTVVQLRAHPARSRQRRPVDGRPDRAAVRAGIWQSKCLQRSKIRRPSACPARTGRKRLGWRSRPIRSSFARFFSRAATSASWPSTAPSMTWPSAARSRSSSRRHSSSKKALPSPTSTRIVASMREACDEAGDQPGHRRHQGRRSRQGRPDLHHDLRHRARS